MNESPTLADDTQGAASADTRGNHTVTASSRVKFQVAQFLEDEDEESSQSSVHKIEGTRSTVTRALCDSATLFRPLATKISCDCNNQPDSREQ